MIPSGGPVCHHFWDPDRFLIFLTTGKGGVGKTTVAAATGVALSSSNERTVVASVDPAHSLGDVMGLPLAGKPVRVADGLFAAEIRLSDALEANWGDIRRYLVRLFRSQGVSELVAEDVAYLPGLEEIAGLLQLRSLAETFDHVVVDCPPTGSTLRYLNLPEAIRWYMEKFFPAERRIVETVGPLAERVSGVPMPGGIVMDQIQDLFNDVIDLRGMLTDPARSVAHVVTTAESVVLKETERAIGYLNLQGINVGRVFVNRCRSDETESVRPRVRPVSAFGLPELHPEPIGLDQLQLLADELRANARLREVFNRSEAISIEGVGDRLAMLIRIPRPADPDDFRVGRRGDDMILDLGPVRRHLPLPHQLARLRLCRASWSTDGLRVEFEA